VHQGRTAPKLGVVGRRIIEYRVDDAAFDLVQQDVGTGPIGPTVGSDEGEHSLRCTLDPPTSFVDEVVVVAAQGRLSHESG